MIDFVVLEGIKVKDDPLKVDYKHIWSLSNQGSLSYIHLFLAASAFIVADDFALDLRLEAFMHTLDVFYCEGEVVEVLKPILDLSALQANKLTACLSTKDRL